MNKHRVLRVSAGAVLTAAAVALTATAAYAFPPAASVGGSTAGAHHNYLANAAVSLTMDAVPSGTAPMSCTGTSLTGDLVDGPGAFTSWFAEVTGGTWSGCTGLGLNLDITRLGTWNLVLTGVPHTDSVTGHTVTSAWIPNVQFEMNDTDAGGALCDVGVTGQLRAQFDNTTQDLTITTSSLTDTVDPNGTGADCLGLLANGGNASFSATYHVTDGSGTAFPILLTA